jgi:hypothetical protein
MNNSIIKYIPLFQKKNSKINTKEIFIKNFNEATSNLFINIDWNNIIVYGDIIFFNTLKEELISKVNFLEIKIILYGLNENKYLEKINYLYSFFSQKIHNKFHFCNINNNIILFHNYTFKNIKINLLRINQKNELFQKIKSNFEKIYFDGENIISYIDNYNLIKKNIIYVTKNELIKYNKCFSKLKIKKKEINNMGLSDKYQNLGKLLILNQNYNINLIDNINYNLYKTMNTLPNNKEFSLKYIYKFIEVNDYKLGNLKKIYKYIPNKTKNKNYSLINNIDHLLKSNENFNSFFLNKNINNFIIDGDLLSQYLIKKNKFEIYKYLVLNHGLSINLNNNSGFYPIHIAAQRGYLNFVQLFYKFDENCINKKDLNYNLTPLFLSIIFNHSNIFDFFWKCKELNKNYIWITNKESLTYLELITKLDRRNIFIYITKNIDLKNKELYLNCIKYNNLNFFKILNKKLNFEKIINDEIIEYSIEYYKKNIINKEFLLYILNNKNSIVKNDNICLNKIINTFDYEIIEKCITKKFKINYLFDNNLTSLNIIRNKIKEFQVEIVNKENDIKSSIWRSNMIRKLYFLLSEFNKITENNSDINIIKESITNLKKIESFIIENNGKYNPNEEKIITPKKINSDIFYGDKYNIKFNLIDLFEFINKKDTNNIRLFLFKNINIPYADIFLKYTNRSCLHLIIEKNLHSELKYLIDIIFKQCEDGIYNYITKKKEFIDFNNIFKINNNNKYPTIFNYLINNIFNKLNNNLSLIHIISDYKSFECLDIFLNNKNIYKKNIYKNLYNLDFLFYNIKNYNIGISYLIFNNIINNRFIINDINKILLETIKYSNVKLFTFLLKTNNINVDLNYKDSYNNNLMHILFNSNYELVKTSLIIKILFKHDELMIYKENNYGITPLNNICIIDDIKLVQNLFQLGIDYDEYDERGLNFIHYCIINNSINLFNFFIKNFNNIVKLKTKKENITPIMLCIIHNRLNMIKQLFSLSDLNHADIYGNTNYHYLIIYSRYNMIPFIDKHNIKNYVGITPNEYKIRKLLITLYNNLNFTDILNLYEEIHERPFKILFTKYKKKYTDNDIIKN